MTSSENKLEPFLVPFTGLAETVRAIAEPVIADEGCELVLFQLIRGNRKTTVRFFIDKTGGSDSLGEDENFRVGLAELERVNRRLSDVLDVEDTEQGLFRGAYLLEVSSPGIDRPLSKRSHFSAAAGRRVRIKTSRSIANAKSHEGSLVGLEGDDIVIARGDKTQAVPLDAVQSATTVFEFSAPAKGAPRRKGKSQAAR